jgi:putative transposase
MAREMLRESDWQQIQSLLPKFQGKQGRPRKDDRKIIEGILWVLRTGAPWRDLPVEFGSWNTVYTRFSRWTASGQWKKMWAILKKRCRQRVTYN